MYTAASCSVVAAHARQIPPAAQSRWNHTNAAPTASGSSVSVPLPIAAVTGCGAQAKSR
jgi:hypothetical protein